ncbi:hypothetical protein TNCT_559791 [Trichonephila clavata]|uniref:Uncharacterized protein n=1 Tax=Trichonephila clavata TaxID=2740835 RepID=A0A8X6GNM2_TRICU|nr:hypothetical protein TNCT_559791 [Trichonephila clavata]
MRDRRFGISSGRFRLDDSKDQRDLLNTVFTSGTVLNSTRNSRNTRHRRRIENRYCGGHENRHMQFPFLAPKILAL